MIIVDTARRKVDINCSSNPIVVSTFYDTEANGQWIVRSILVSLEELQDIVSTVISEREKAK